MQAAARTTRKRQAHDAVPGAAQRSHRRVEAEPAVGVPRFLQPADRSDEALEPALEAPPVLDEAEAAARGGGDDAGGDGAEPGGDPKPPPAGPGDEEAAADRIAAAALRHDNPPPPARPPGAEGPGGSGGASGAGSPSGSGGPSGGTTGASAPPPRRPGGHGLGTLAASVRWVTGVDLGGVRVHPAPHLTRMLQARAFARGGDIFVGGPVAAPVLAHEAGHVARQALSGQARVACWSDPTISSLGADDVATWSDEQVLDGIRLLLDQMAPAAHANASPPAGDPTASRENLRLLVASAASRRLAIADDLMARLPEDVGSADPTELFAMNARHDLMNAMLARDFADAAPTTTQRLDGYRRLYPWLDSAGLEQARVDLDAAVAALETAARIHRVARDPGGDATTSTAITELNDALLHLLAALLTPHLPACVAAVELARDGWLEHLVQTFADTVAGVRSQVETAIAPNAYGFFSSGLPYHLHEPMADTIATLEAKRAGVVRGLDQLAEDTPGTPATLEVRLGYVADHNQELDRLLAEAEAVQMGIALCQQGQTLADATWDSYQINRDNYLALWRLSGVLNNLAGGAQSRAGMAALRAEVTGAYDQAGARVTSIREYEAKVRWMANIAATLLGIGAMRAVMAIPQVIALGRTGAAIVGSLAFTGTRLALTNNQGRPWTVGGVAEDALKDYFLLRLLGGVDARIVARVGDAGVLASAARLGGTYGTLVAWTLTWNAIQPPGAPGIGAGSSAGDVMLQTGIDLAVLLIAEALLRAPSLPSTSLAPARDPAAREQVRQQWEAYRGELESTGTSLRDWLRGPRDDVTAGDGLLARAARLFARGKGLNARLAEVGEITAEQQAQLDAHVDAMQESIRNARDEVRLGVRPASAETSSYQGSAENISAYLARLVTQGRILELRPEGNGVFSYRTPDGALRWFFPEGQSSPVIDLDIVAESVDATAPDVAGPTRSQALVHLRGAGSADLPGLVGALPPGRGGPFIEWAARADVGATLADGGLPMPLVRAIAAGPPQQLASVASANPHHLAVWYQAWVSRHPDGMPGEFLDTVRDVMTWRGTMEVASAADAGALLDRRASAVTPAVLELAPSGPSISAPGTPTPRYSDLVTRALQGRTVAGASHSEIVRGDVHWVIERVGGNITRLLQVDANATVALNVPVTTHMATLREVLSAVRNAPDEAAARSELARADAPLAALDLLLDLRSGVPPEQVYLMDALAHHPLRGNAIAPAAPAEPDALVCDPSDPMASLPPELQAVVNALPTDVQQAMNSMAAWDMSNAPVMLRNPVMIAAFRADPGNAAIFLRTLAETQGLPLYEPHLHGRGALRFAQRMALDLIEVRPSARPAMLTKQLAFGDAMAGLLDAPGFPTSAQWAAKRPQLEALVTRLGTTPAGRVSPTLRTEAQQLGRDIEASLHLGIERSGTPQLQRFFSMYHMIIGNFGSEGLPAILSDQAAGGTGGLELRSGEGLPRVDPITGGTRRVLSTPGGILSTGNRAGRQQQLQQMFKALGHPEVVGFDKSGEEAAGHSLGVLTDTSLVTQASNYWVLADWLGARPNTAAAVRATLGYDPLGADSMALFQRIIDEQATRRDAIMSDAAALPAELPAAPLADFAAQVRGLRSAIARIGAEAAQHPGVEAELAGGAMPEGMRGITIHAGEQLASARAGMGDLLAGVEHAIDAGADRIGHGTVLGIRFPADLAQLGFRAQPDGSWQRSVAAAGGAMVAQSIPADEIPRLEARRLAALGRIASLGIALEVPPTSNIVLSGLPPLRHPVGQMLADAPSLRVVAATDNPAIHRTNLATETAWLAASGGMALPRRTVLYLEGFASRLGSRPLDNVPTLRSDIAASIIANTPSGDRLAVLQAMYDRWPAGAMPDAATAADPAAFDAAVRRMLRGIIY